MTHITLNMLRMLSVTVPDLSQQETVADYLDVETGRINALISKKSRVIELLDERRRAVITGAVTGNMNVPPSCRRHLMDGWRKFKHFCSCLPQYGLNVPASDYASAGTRFIRTSDINDRGEMAEVDPVYVKDSIIGPKYQLQEGDLLLSRSGTLGRCLRYQHVMGKATFAGYLIRFRPNNGSDPRFIEYCTQSKFFQQAIEAEAPSSTISNFNAERYANLPLPWWTLDRQRAIADFLDIETGHIDALVSKAHRMIGLLTERRQALVTAAVTGRLAVPGVAA